MALIIAPKVSGDECRFFFDMLRGLYYQIRQSQGKLMQMVQSAVFDVTVDICKSAPIFSQHVAVELSADNKRMAWMPEDFAHAFLVLSETAEFLYKTIDDRAPELFKRSIAWSNPAINIEWPLLGAPTLSAKDQQAKPFTKVGCVT